MDVGVDAHFPERAVDECSQAARESSARAVPDPELLLRPRRRSFPAAYKLRILAEAEAARGQGEIGALLRREGLYSSALSKWRRERDRGALAALGKPKGRRPEPLLASENVALRRRLARTEAELTKARQIIEVQGNISALLGELLGTEGAGGQKNTER